jgi:UDP-GlcNAc:undecaprenyl-phosphate GlcNAc-1-phosphate transferase
MDTGLAAYIGEFCVAFVLGVVLVPYVRSFAVRVGAVDVPDKVRKMHARTMPRLGGLAVFLAFVLALGMPPVLGALMKAMGSDRPLGLLEETLLEVWPEVVVILGAGVLVLVVGVYDDIRGTRPIHKIAAQAAAALIIYYGISYVTGTRLLAGVGIPFTDIRMPIGPWLGPLVTVAWIIVCSNAINLIDGMDGLAGGVSVVAFLTIFCFCLFTLATTDVTAELLDTQHRLVLMCFLSTAMAGAVTGFLLYNFPPAVVFLGDSGSLFLGLMIGAISLRGAFKSQLAFTMIVPVLAIGLPLLDTGLAVIRRWAKGLPFSVPDRYHIHHRLLRMGFTPRQAVVLLYAVSVIFGAVGLILITYGEGAADRVALVFVLVGALVLVAIYLLSGSEVREMVIKVASDVRRKRLVRRYLVTSYRYSQQLESAESVGELWEVLKGALEKIGFDTAEMEVSAGPTPAKFCWTRTRTRIATVEGRTDTWRGTLALGPPEARLGELRLEIEVGRRSHVPESIDIAADLRDQAADRLAALTGNPEPPAP